jgi:hypothetical protein
MYPRAGSLQALALKGDSQFSYKLGIRTDASEDHSSALSPPSLTSRKPVVSFQRDTKTWELISNILGPGVMMHIYNSSSQKAEARGLVQGQPDDSETQTQNRKMGWRYSSVIW